MTLSLARHLSFASSQIPSTPLRTKYLALSFLYLPRALFLTITPYSSTYTYPTAHEICLLLLQLFRNDVGHPH